MSCADCWAASLIGWRHCYRHSNDEEKAEFDKNLKDLANQEHPFLKMLRER